MSNEQQPKYQLMDAVDFWFVNLSPEQQQFILTRPMVMDMEKLKIYHAFLHMSDYRSHPDWPADTLRKV